MPTSDPALTHHMMTLRAQWPDSVRLYGKTYTAEGRTWTVDHILYPWSYQHPEPGGKRLYVQDREHGGPVVPASEVSDE